MQTTTKHTTPDQQKQALLQQFQTIIASHYNDTVVAALEARGLTPELIEEYTTAEVRQIVGVPSHIINSVLQARGFYRHKTTRREGGRIVTVYKYKREKVE